jgi:aminoglycoside phosphotransferase (APT) family kinase protein
MSTIAAVDVVGTRAEAAQLAVAPLLVLEGLEPYIPGSGEIEVRRLGDGHSNETFSVTRSGRSWVLRRPPRPPLAPTAHDVLREYSVIAALAAAGAPVPAPLLASDDLDAIGAPFYLMELVDGITIRDAPPTGLDDPVGRRGIGEQLVDGLVSLHSVDWADTELARIGRPAGYLERQLRRWASQWEHNQTRALPDIDELGRRLAATMPQTARVTVVHGDYKLDNVLFAPSAPARLVAIIDWELATLGDPLADLGFLLATYVAPGTKPDPVLGFSPMTGREGSLTLEEIADRYAAATASSLVHIDWYQCLALWKLAILLEGSYKRFLAGASGDTFFALLGDGIPRLAARGIELSASL